MREKPLVDAARTALLVVDMQNAFLEASGVMFLPVGPLIVPAVVRTVALSRDAGMKIVWTRMSHEYMQGGAYPVLFPQHFHADGSPKLRRGTRDFEILDALAPAPADIFIDKFKYSAFRGTNLASILGQAGCDTVIVAGIATNVCCESTARDAFALDFRVIMLSDATTTGSNAAHEAALRTIGLAFGYVQSVVELEAGVASAG